MLLRPSNPSPISNKNNGNGTSFRNRKFSIYPFGDCYATSNQSMVTKFITHKEDIFASSHLKNQKFIFFSKGLKSAVVYEEKII
jgi:hypothetical protein